MPLMQTTAMAELRVFEALGEPCGIMLWCPSTGEAAFQFRKDWEEFAGEEADVLSGLPQQLERDFQKFGPEAFLRWVDSDLSTTLSIQPPKTTLIGHIDRSVQTFYRKYVKSTPQRYVTHLPLWELEATGGSFQGDVEAVATEWLEVEVPGRKAWSKDYFVAHIHGRSMEPEIPDGSLCLFRFYYGGSRKGGIYLVQRMATSEGGGQFTIKRYDSDKEQTEQGCRHTRIGMHAENPEFADWSLQETETYVTVAQFVRVVGDPGE
jgi:hypothetical protein